MTIKRSGLGRNLSALLSHTALSVIDNAQIPALDTRMLAIEQLVPGKYQPRGDIDEATLQELANSIKQQGLLQPLVVRKVNETRFEIIAGERRWRASKLAALTHVPVIIKQVDDETAMAMALIENLQREDLNAMDQARAMARLTTEFELTHQQVADILSKSRAAVSNYLRLLSLGNEVKYLLEQGDIDMGHARALLSLDAPLQNDAAKIIIAKNLSVRETERLVERLKSDGPVSKAILPEIHPDIQVRLNAAAKKINASIQLKPSSDKKGRLIIQYNNPETIEKILSFLS